jgi:hypothetical protein
MAIQNRSIVLVVGFPSSHERLGATAAPPGRTGRILYRLDSTQNETLWNRYGDGNAKHPHELPAGQKTEPLQLEIIESAHWKLNANRFGALRRSTLSWCRSSRAPPDMPEIENWGSSYETAPLAGD